MASLQVILVLGKEEAGARETHGTVGMAGLRMGLGQDQGGRHGQVSSNFTFGPAAPRTQLCWAAIKCSLMLPRNPGPGKNVVRSSSRKGHRARVSNPDPLNIGTLGPGSKAARQVEWKVWIRGGSEGHWEWSCCSLCPALLIYEVTARFLYVDWAEVQVPGTAGQVACHRDTREGPGPKGSGQTWS